MGFFTKDIKTLNDLFVHTLQDIYYAEQQIAKNLPDMVSKATDATLKTASKNIWTRQKIRSRALNRYSKGTASKPKALIAPRSTAF